jgi:preprotein translocase subunit YajC
MLSVRVVARPVGRIAVKELGSLVPFLLIAVVFWLLLIRPQRKRALELSRVQRSLTVGDQVMLGSGFVATVSELPEEGEFLGVELSPGVRVRVARGAIARVIEPVSTGDDAAPPTDLTKH